MKLEGRVEDKINLLEYSINCKFELTKMQKRTIRELLEEQKDIIENNEKEKAIEIIANKLNEKQISNEKEMLTNLDKDKEIERLNNIINEVREYIEERYNGEVLTHTFDKDNVGELLEILQGSEKE